MSDDVERLRAHYEGVYKTCCGFAPFVLSIFAVAVGLYHEHALLPKEAAPFLYAALFFGAMLTMVGFLLLYSYRRIADLSLCSARCVFALHLLLMACPAGAYMLLDL